MSPDKLRVRQHQVIKAAHHNGLVDLAEELAIRRGSLKGRHAPDGFTPLVKPAKVSLALDYAFLADVGGDVDKVTLSFTAGHVEGIVPTIAGLDLLDVDAEGEPPVLTVPDEAWRKVGRTERAQVMFRYQLRAGDFSVEAVEVVAVPAPPVLTGREWFKLVGFLVRFNGDVQWFPQMFFPQYFSVSEVHGTNFRPWPRAGA